MRTIHKIPIATDNYTILLPAGAEILTAQQQKGEVFLWAMVDTESPNQPRRLRAFGTGFEIPADIKLEYVSTIMFHDGALVFHIFEEEI